MKKNKDALEDTQLNLFTIRHTAFVLVKHNNVKFKDIFVQVTNGIICALKDNFKWLILD